MAKYLNSAGVTYLWQKIKALLSKPFKVAGSDGSYTSIGGGSVATGNADGDQTIIDNDGVTLSGGALTIYEDTSKGGASTVIDYDEAVRLKGLKNYTLPAASGTTLGGVKSGGDVTITTPNADELVRLARSIIDKVEMGATMKLDAAGMAEMYNIPSDCFTEAVGFFPMMISADTIVIGKVADGKLDAAKEALEAQRALTQQNFEQYLPEPLERAKNGQIVTSGDYIMLIISGDNDTAIRMFQDGVK